MQIRIDRLKQVLQANRESTAPFDIEYWARKTDCGTTHCLIGNYIVAFPENGLGLYWCLNPKITAASLSGEDRYDHFGLTYRNFDYLFMPDEDDDGVTCTKEERLQRLEDFIVEHENDEQTP